MKIHLSIQARLIVLMFILVAGFSGFLLYQRSSENIMVTSLFQDMVAEKTVSLDQFIKIKSAPLEVLSRDYTLWDEMIGFVANPDPKWAKDNLETAFSTFDTDAIWVYRPDFSLVYSKNTLSDPAIDQLPVPKQAWKNIFSQGYFCHFFATTDKGVMEIFGAPVQPSSDVKRLSRPRGYFFVGRLWDKGYTNELAKLMKSKIWIIPAVRGVPFAVENKESGVMVFSKVLKDWQGDPLVKVYLRSDSEVIRSLHFSSRTETAFLVLFSLLIFFSLSILLLFWIGRPLNLISHSLLLQNSSSLGGLKKSNTEFGNLACLIDDFFIQKDKLVKEVQERQRVERILQKINDELEGRIAERTSDLISVNQRLSKELEDNKRLQEQFLQAQKMEIIGRLAGGVAHDFNNILMVISNYAGFVKDALPKDDPIREDVNQISEAAGRAASLTGQLLAFSRRQVIAPAVININERIAQMEKMLRRLIGEDVELKTDLFAPKAMIKVDPGNMDQVVTNLVINARDAMPSGGNIFIETKNATLSQGQVADLPAGDYLNLSISDTGSGMSDEVKSHLFEPFFTTKERGKGTGLGLATIYGIVKQHKGSISVDSVKGKGTTFKIYLPLAAEGAMQEKKEERRLSLRGTETILLVEDDTPVRDVVSKMLFKLGYTVLEATCAEDAFAVAKKYLKPIHLVIADIVLPRINGKEMADELVRQIPGLKVLYASGYTGDISVYKSIMEEGMPFIQKPFSEDLLAMKIREILK
jgi:signal transduction histidine kinase